MVKANESRSENISEYLCIFLAVAFLGALTYHPFFFGDEITPWFLVDKSHGGFIQALFEYSQYKPRVIFNSLWMAIPTWELSRAWPATITIFFEAASAILIYKLLRRPPALSTKIVALIGTAAFISSRFSIAIWYDYVSGIIESFSFFMFLCGVSIFTDLNERLSRKRIFQAFLFFSAAVFIHERYAFAVVALGLYYILFNRNDSKERILLAIFSLLPGVMFVGANLLIGGFSVTTGTAGQEVRISLDVVEAFFIYCSNVFLQTNIGLDWYVGALNWSHYLGKIICIGSALIFLGIYLYEFKNDKKSHQVIFLIGALLVSILALIFVASLPGTSRQEARWMHPALGLLIIIGGLLFTKNLKILFFTFLLLINLTHFFSGSLSNVYNVVASKTAHKIGSAVSSTIPHAKTALIVGDNSSSWVFGGNSVLGNSADNGRIFSIANRISSIQVDPSSKDLKQIDKKYEIIFLSTGMDQARVPIFTQLKRSSALMLLGMEQDTDLTAPKYIGRGDSWNNWRLDEGMKTETGLIVGPNKDGFYEANADDVNGNIITYRAHTIDNQPVAMRLQINWHDANQKFISTAIKVVSVTSTSNNFSTLASAPSNASKALIYVTLHDAQTDSVIIESIHISRSGD